MKHVAFAEMNAAIEMERRRVAPENALAVFRKITGKKAAIRKNRWGKMECAAKVGWENVDKIQDALKAAGIWCNSMDGTIFLAADYWHNV